LLEASQLLNSSLNLNEVLERILDLSMTSLGAERGLLILSGDGPVTSSGYISSLVADMPEQVFLAKNMGPENLQEEEFVLSRTVLQEVHQSGEAVVISDAGKAPGFEEPDGQAPAGPLSILCVPLLDQGRPTGLLYLDNRLVSQLFTDKDLSFLDSLASLAVNAIRNAKSYEEIHRLKQKLQKEVEYLTEEIQTEYNFDEMIGSSKPVQRVFDFIVRAAPLDQPVLIQGETGTGKELVARAIHRRSPRGREPLIKINCAAIPEGLLESELFGYEKGAFTGASRNKAGRFELADGGTLFLDEIGEMSPALQAKLLTVLEDGEFERLGSTRTRRVDIRLITATNRDLEKEVEEGRFRKDLFYRIKVLPVLLPPLRERPGDIPLLVAYFVDRLNKKFNKGVTHVERQSIEEAQAYPWPGNVRELEHVVERAMALADTPALRLSPLLSRKAEEAGVDVGPEISDMPLGPFHESVDAYRRRLIRAALQRTGGKKREAASLLGLSPSNLSKMLKKLDIEA
jgi:transcriptional regulator with GAF, ATPase, and Fis domain